MLTTKQIRENRDKFGITKKEMPRLVNASPGERITALMQEHSIDSRALSEATGLTVLEVLRLMSLDKITNFGGKLEDFYKISSAISEFFLISPLWVSFGEHPREWEDMPETTVGYRITKLLNEYDLGYRELGAAVGRGISAISGWTNDQSRPRIEVIERLSWFFGVSQAWLLTGHNPASDYQPDLLEGILTGVYSACEEQGIDFSALPTEKQVQLISLMYQFFFGKPSLKMSPAKAKSTAKEMLKFMGNPGKKNSVDPPLLAGYR